MKIASIQWKKKFPHCGVDPRKAYKAIEELRERNEGVVSADMLVRAARDSDHPLHPIIFEKTNREAAEEHRKHVARTILRALEVTYKEAPKSSVRAFNTVYRAPPGDEEKRTLYKSMDDILADPQARHRLIAQAISEMVRWRGRYQALQELEIIFQALDQAVKEMEIAT